MNIEKVFEITLSHKFPDGNIASVKMGTRREIMGLLEGAPEEEIIKISQQLAESLYNETMENLKQNAKKNPIIREVVAGIRESLKIEENEREAEKALKDA
jgi:hypothetical protein